MGHSDDPGDGTHGCGTRGCGGNMLVAEAPPQQGNRLGRNIRALMNMIAAARATRQRDRMLEN